MWPAIIFYKFICHNFLSDYHCSFEYARLICFVYKKKLLKVATILEMLDKLLDNGLFMIGLCEKWIAKPQIVHEDDYEAINTVKWGKLKGLIQCFVHAK